MFYSTPDDAAIGMHIFHAMRAGLCDFTFKRGRNIFQGGTFCRQFFFIIYYLGGHLNPERCPTAVFPQYIVIFILEKNLW